jgi:glucuronate isomerase
MINSKLNKYRYFDPDPTIREIAYKLYSKNKDLPIICPHGHVDPGLFTEDKPFSNPTELILIPDHYVFRLMYSQGVKLESLGIPTIDGTEIETDPRKIWQIFGDHFYLYAGTPTGQWLNHEFKMVFDIDIELNSDTAMEFYDELTNKLQQPEYFPRTLYDRFNIEVLNTTDAATDLLEEHQQIKDSGWNARIIPCFRPDSLLYIGLPDWKINIELLSQVSGIEVNSYSTFISALENRREFFKGMGAVSTDHAVVMPLTEELTTATAEAIFQRALMGRADADDESRFMAHMLMEMARMSIEDGLVMQLHAGSFRNHNQFIFNRFGRDKGADIPVKNEFTRNLRALLNRYGNNPDLTLIVFTLDESNYARELAPLAGHYPAMKLGPAWWFHDSINGMTRFREMVTETASIYNTVGFNDDTRAFPSIPARHDLSRRVDSNFLARMVASYQLSLSDAHRMAKALAYDLVKSTYKL